MDVRCENCDTEYELDDSKLKPGGVTVKCAACGHMFKVRKRAITSLGTGEEPPRPRSTVVAGVPPQPAPPSGRPARSSERRPVPASDPRRPRNSPRVSPARPGDKPSDVTRPMATPPELSGIPRIEPGMQAGSNPLSGGSGPTQKDRIWLIQLENGAIEKCRELATLQQWIVSGKITRSCSISRTGKTWKSLGEIRELAEYFDIADEARQTRPRPAATPASVAAAGVADAVADARTSTMLQPKGAPVGEPPAMPNFELEFEPEPVAPVSAATTTAATAAAARAAKAAMAAGDDRRTGHWAVAGKHHLHGDADGPTGPTGGLARGIPTDDVAFTRGKIAPMRDDFSAGRDAGDTGGHTGGDDYDDLDDLDAIPQRSGVGRWIVVASLLLIAGAGVALYLLVFRAPNKGAGDTGDTPVAEVKGDAGAAVPAALDAATAEPEQDPLTAAQAALAGDVAAAIEAADAPLAEMAKADGGDVDIALLVTRARIQTALAQKRVDAASAVAADDKAAAKALQREADKFVIKALELGQKARKLGGDDVGALVVMADVSRLQRKRTRDVDRYLTPALKQDKENREARLVRAMLLARDGKADRARAAFEALANEDGAADDVRPVYRLALLSFAAKDMDAARRYANQVVAAQAEHEGAKALLARIDEVTRVSTADPLPPEVGDDDDDGGSSGPVGVDAYDGLLSRADKKAETGNCREAMKLYDRALDANPSGVAALVGLGICHVDQREFASAHSKFRAALGISPRYQDALWGIAEAYQQQGLKPQAVNAFKKFLEEHPNSRRAEAARRRIELLGGSTGGSSDGDDDDDSGGAGGGTGTTGGGTTGGGTTGGGTTGGGTTGGGTGDGAGGGDTGGDTGGGTGGGGTGGGTTGGDTGGGGGSGGTGDPPPTPDPDSAAESG